MGLCELMFDIQMFVRDVTPGPFWDAILSLLFRLPRELLGCPMLYTLT
jgi:hypothetical protein